MGSKITCLNCGYTYRLIGKHTYNNTGTIKLCHKCRPVNFDTEIIDDMLKDMWKEINGDEENGNTNSSIHK
jgi:hypothetical protein